MKKDILRIISEGGWLPECFHMEYRKGQRRPWVYTNGQIFFEINPHLREMCYYDHDEFFCEPVKEFHY